MYYCFKIESWKSYIVSANSDTEKFAISVDEPNKALLIRSTVITE